jgi:hypothetical protein
MVDTLGAYSFPAGTQPGNERSQVAGEEKAEATVISAKFSDRELLTVHVVADKLLSDCWSKACEFARNFESPSIEIQHLLLGASHIRDAEEVLSAVCDDIAELTRHLSGLCAHRQFAETPKDNKAYEASQQLRVLLCQAAALAAKKDVPNLTLALVIEALAEADPRPAALDALPKLQRRDAVAVANARALEELRGKIDGLTALMRSDMLPRLGELQQHAVSADTTRQNDQEATLRTVMTWLRDEIAAPTKTSVEVTRELHALLVEPIRDQITGRPVLRMVTATQLHEALRPLLPSPLPTVVEEPEVPMPQSRVERVRQWVRRLQRVDY